MKKEANWNKLTEERARRSQFQFLARSARIKWKWEKSALIPPEGSALREGSHEGGPGDGSAYLWKWYSW